MSLETEPQTDGRRARSAKTRDAIVTAMMDLIADGTFQPTSEEVAARAGVGHRTVFRHFQDMDTLYREIDARLTARFLDGVEPVGPEGSLQERVRRMVKMRSNLYENIKMFRRATYTRQWTSEFLGKARARYAKLSRELIHNALPELGKLPVNIQYTVEMLLSFEGWEQLRVEQKRSVATAQESLIQSILVLMTKGDV